MALSVGTEISGYRIEAVLGSGQDHHAENSCLARNPEVRSQNLRM